MLIDFEIRVIFNEPQSKQEISINSRMKKYLYKGILYHSDYEL